MCTRERVQETDYRTNRQTEANINTRALMKAIRQHGDSKRIISSALSTRRASVNSGRPGNIRGAAWNLDEIYGVRRRLAVISMQRPTAFRRSTEKATNAKKSERLYTR